MTAALITLAILVIAFLISLFLVPMLLSRKLLEPRCTSHLQSIDEKSSSGQLDLEMIDSLDQESFKVMSPLGYDLKGKIFLYDGSRKVVILVHGYTSNYTDMLKYLMLWRNLGFTVMAFDQRGHGDSGKALITMGYRESQDLQAMVSYARQRFGSSCILGLHGESMGATTVMMAVSRIVPHVDFAVEDCGYSNLYDQCAHIASSLYHMPKRPYMNLARAYVKREHGFDMLDDVNAEKSLESAKDTPMLFVHTDSDSFVPTSMVFRNYGSKPGFKRIRLFKGSGHATSFSEHREDYAKCVQDFLKELGI